MEGIDFEALDCQPNLRVEDRVAMPGCSLPRPSTEEDGARHLLLLQPRCVRELGGGLDPVAFQEPDVRDRRLQTATPITIGPRVVEELPGHLQKRLSRVSNLTRTSHLAQALS